MPPVQAQSGQTPPAQTPSAQTPPPQAAPGLDQSAPLLPPPASALPPSDVAAGSPAPGAEVPLPPIPMLDEGQAFEEAMRLRADFHREVPVALHLTAEQQAQWIALARQQVEQAGYVIDRPQVMIVVDRNPAVQRLCLLLVMPGQADWQVIGGTRVSTGTTGRKYYYITPTGIFTNTADRLGYRALGTKNENGIRGIGAKGMRVWDFGWQWAEKGWLPSREKGQIRLEMHATDPDFLERRLGRTASEGCIRIPATLNVFLDRHGLLDVAYEQKAAVDRRFRALLRPDRTPSPLAGLAVLVLDTAPPPADARKTAGLRDEAAHRAPANG
ncbi:L,D-transpeptidase [Acetobacter sp. TBRC 12305]|uniref:L,D-transpeptidase n=1 Tax=Acetobacter garciniae TaxID=2817435 RepID=A0A939HLE8_9PROT|nr:L,D-transpeptidase [Acetobacter garciniae]MBX0343463.1 L,D-transpeptidase [Acetobacter garciniae]